MAVAKQSDQEAALESMDAWAHRLPQRHRAGHRPGARDPRRRRRHRALEGSGQRTHDAIEGSELVVIEDGPHGINASHAREFNEALLKFLEK